MSTDVKKHTSIAPGEKPTRAGLAAAIFSIDDIIPVANTTEATQVATAVAAAGQTLASNPVTVSRTDARGLHRIEYSYDGSVWIPTSGVLSFTTKSAADSWASSNAGLLSSGDRCVVGTTEYRYRYGGWVPVDPLVAVTTSGGQSGITTATTITGLSVSLTLGGTAALRFTAGVTHYATVTDTVLALSIMDGASTLTTWTRQANSSPSAANSGNGSTFQMIIPAVGAGSHTFTLQATRAAGSGTVSIAPSATNQCYLSVEVI